MTAVKTEEPVIVRRLKKTDYEEVSSIYRGVIEEYLLFLKRAGKEEFARERRSLVRTVPRGHFEFYSRVRCSFVALARGRAVGFIMAQPVPWTDFVDRVLWLEFIAVRRAFRGRGVGFALLSSVMAWGARRGIGSVFTTLNPNNEASKALLCKAGFEVRERLTATRPMP
jgi:ribosomal protein S18 acetylase RimI-like enzyme